MISVIGGVPFDGRCLDKATSEETLRCCIERLSKDNELDGVDVWLTKVLIRSQWGYTLQVQEAIDGCEGSSEGLFLKGLQCYWGYGVAVNKGEAVRLWNEGVKLGDTRGFFRASLAFYYWWKRDYDKYLQLLREAVRCGNPSAQYVLGDRYWYGDCGVVEDQSEAMRLWTLSHQQGYVPATFKLGEISEDPRLKLAYHLQAAARGFGRAVRQLDTMQRDDPDSVVPFGFWSPQRHIHKYLTESIHMQMVSLLIANSRSSCLVSRLPKDIILTSVSSSAAGRWCINNVLMI